jgi:hypothetical protein
MPNSTKFMMGCVLAGLGAISIAAGAAISHQTGNCRLKVTDGTALSTGVLGLNGLSVVCEQLPEGHRANLLPFIAEVRGL